MGAHPKNKITRVEQGKRRAGNTPKLKKDVKNALTPLHKKTLATRFLTLVQGTLKQAAKAAPVKKDAAPVTKGESSTAVTTAVPVTPKAIRSSKVTTMAPAAKKMVKRSQKGK